MGRDLTAQATVDDYVARGEVTGLAWGVARGDEVATGVAGTLEPGGAAVELDSIFRISSMTKPVTAVAALMLVDDGVLALDCPVDEHLPELADRQVLVNPDGPIDDTVPADRPITLRDLLTFRLGIGIDFTRWGRQPVLDALASHGLGVGPPKPGASPSPDEWMKIVGSVPLEWQPGTRWLYHTSGDVLGVLIATASGMRFDEFLDTRIFGPLGMVDTAFSVPAGKLDRFGGCYSRDPQSGELVTFDEPDGDWSRPPAFCSGGAGLVSTVADFLTFGRMLRCGGTHDGTRLVSERLVGEMATNQLSSEQVLASADPSGTQGWGFGVGVQLVAAPGRPAGTYGWDGGMGSSFANVPSADLTGVLLTTDMWASPDPPPVCHAFWNAVA